MDLSKKLGNYSFLVLTGSLLSMNVASENLKNNYNNSFLLNQKTIEYIPGKIEKILKESFSKNQKLIIDENFKPKLKIESKYGTFTLSVNPELDSFKLKYKHRF